MWCVCTAFRLQTLYEKWCKLLDAVPERDTAMETELQSQQQNEALRVQFAEVANEVGAYIEARSSALAELSMQGKDTMEEQLEAVKAFQADTLSYQPKLDEAEASNQVRGVANQGRGRGHSISRKRLLKCDVTVL